MKKKYIKPDFEAIKVTHSASILAGSDPSAKEATTSFTYEDEEEYDDVPW